MATARTTKGTRKTVAPIVDAPEVTREQLLEEIESELRRNIDQWLPRAVDEKGGFHQSFDREWKRPKKEDPKFVVFQSRLTWLAATAIVIEPKRKKEFDAHLQHGFSFLSTKHWDPTYGGFYDCVGKEGKPVTEGIGQVKSLYGNSFALYALAAMYRAKADLFALDLAFEAFEWIDSYGHDDLNGGYFNVVSIEGKPVPEGSVVAPDETKIPGIKTMNTQIHLLESFTELLRAADHSVVRERVEELLAIVRDRIATPEGYLIEHLTEDWTPISKHNSFGHDVETAFLLVDSASVLGRPADEATLKVARALVDRSLQYGWNAALGSLAFSGDVKGKVVDAKTVWWASAEALNAFLLMHELFGSETDKYWKAFVAQWTFIKNHHIDVENGGWYEFVDEAGTPTSTQKGGAWKEAYHETRAMQHVCERLRRLGEDSAKASLGKD